MQTSHSDALVFFGASGDLAFKKIFPALQSMVRRGHLDMPVIGVAKSGWDLEKFKARAKDSIAKHSTLDAAAFAKLCSLLKYIDGDYKDAATFTQLRGARGRQARSITWRYRRACSKRSLKGLPGPVARQTPASSWKSRSAAISLRPRS